MADSVLAGEEDIIKGCVAGLFLPPSGFSEALFRTKKEPQNIQNKVLFVYSLSASKNNSFRHKFHTFDRWNEAAQARGRIVDSRRLMSPLVITSRPKC